MLLELTVENFAIIDRLEVQFSPGLVTFTGETGAGKSIIIDAVESLLGGRIDSTIIRTGAERALVEGVFHIPAATRADVCAILERESLLDDPETLTLGREIRSNGRNVARVNGRNVNTGLLRELGEFLVDIHGQSEHLSLLRVNQHLSMLDELAALLPASQRPAKTPPFSKVLTTYQQSYQRFQAIQHELDRLHKDEEDAARRLDLLNYQVNEIEAARLQPGEEETLLEERNRLANAEGIANLIQEALQQLDESAVDLPTITDLFGQTIHTLGNLARLDPSQAGLVEAGEMIAESLNDLVRSLRNYLEGIEFNPKRLDQIEERLALFHSLKKKYGNSLQAVLDYAEKASQQRDSIAHSGERIEELEAERENLLIQLGKDGQVLSQMRNTAAQNLGQAVEGELADLSMAGARFRVDFQQQADPQGVPLEDGQKVAFYPTGLERIEFMIAPNPGEGFKPLARIASGGETSRLMLALKDVLARADQIPTLIFDEIDQGIGGRVGTIVGYKLWRLGRQHQVLCVTHLPQLAAFGDQHYHVQKRLDSGRTLTQVDLLQGDARLAELAQMLGGISEGTLVSAQEILELVHKQTMV